MFKRIIKRITSSIIVYAVIQGVKELWARLRK